MICATATPTIAFFHIGAVAQGILWAQDKHTHSWSPRGPEPSHAVSSCFQKLPPHRWQFSFGLIITGTNGRYRWIASSPLGAFEFCKGTVVFTNGCFFVFFRLQAVACSFPLFIVPPPHKLFSHERSYGLQRSDALHNLGSVAHQFSFGFFHEWSIETCNLGKQCVACRFVTWLLSFLIVRPIFPLFAFAII